MLYGLLVRIGQLGCILLALQFSEIFKNPAQIIFLLPIAVIVIVLLGVLTLVEIECNKYVENLDRRLDVVNFYMGKDLMIGRRGFLRKPFLPAALNFLSLPILFIFLSWTSIYLFLVLLVSICISTYVILRFNDNSKEGDSEAENDINSHDDGHEIPMHLIKGLRGKNLDQINKGTSLTLSFPTQNNSKSNGSTKRKILVLIRQSTRIILLMLAVILVVFNVTTLPKIAGFLLIGNYFRTGCLSLLEYITSTDSLFPLKATIELLGIALLSEEDIKSSLLESFQNLTKNREDFNSKYQKLIGNHPYFRLKNTSILDPANTKIAFNITSRIKLEPITIVQIENNYLASKVKKFILNSRKSSSKSFSEYLVSGESFLGKKKLWASFYESIEIHNPYDFLMTTTDIYAYFDDDGKKSLAKLLQSSPELRLFIDSMMIENTPVRLLNPRQTNQFKSLMQLLSIYLEPTCLSLSLYLLDNFDDSDIRILLKIFEPLFKEKSIYVVMLTRIQPPKGLNLPFYKFTPDSLIRN